MSSASYIKILKKAQDNVINMPAKCQSYERSGTLLTIKQTH